MKCPRCHNIGFIPTEEVKWPIKNLGHKERYDSFDSRHYVCLQCGYSWRTKEEFWKEVKVRTRERNVGQQKTR